MLDLSKEYQTKQGNKVYGLKLVIGPSEQYKNIVGFVKLKKSDDWYCRKWEIDGNCTYAPMSLIPARRKTHYAIYQIGKRPPAWTSRKTEEDLDKYIETLEKFYKNQSVKFVVLKKSSVKHG